MSHSYRIEALAQQDRATFDCGVKVLTDYFRKQARQDVRKRVAACYVLIDTARDTGQIAGYYTISSAVIPLTEIPTTQQKKLPRYPDVPAFRIGRLAVDTSHQGKGCGGYLVYDAIKRGTTSGVGAYAVIVDAKDDNAVSFYERYGFTKFRTKPKTLFLPISKAIKNLSEK